MNLSLFPLKKKEKKIREKTKSELIVDFFFELKDWDDMPKSFYREERIIYGRYVKPAQQLLELFDNDLEEAKSFLEKIASEQNGKGLDFSIETCFKKYPEYGSVKG